MEHYATALVLGLAGSGKAAARLLASEGTRVLAVDREDNAKLRETSGQLMNLGVEVALGQKDVPEGKVDVGIVSPGISVDSHWIRTMAARGIPVLSELELGWSRARCRVLAITGSNGKSTLVKLCTEALTQAGMRTAMAGNYGPPVSEVVATQGSIEWLVLEVSSFQLETVDVFRPDIGVLLNIHSNHLDRHHSMDNYIKIKARLFAHMRTGDTAIVHEGAIDPIRANCSGTPMWVMFGQSDQAQYRYRDGSIRIEGKAEETGIRSLSFAGTVFHNPVLGQAAAAATAVGFCCGIPLETVVQAAKAFQPLPHRMQELAVIRGIRFVDDSKATNVAALEAALRMSSGSVRLIAGGLPKYDSFESIRTLIGEKVAGAYLIGKAAESMVAAWQEVTPCIQCGHLDAAVAKAWQDARPGDTILLSPACASFDQFRDFEERGDRFSRWVRTISEDKRHQNNA